MNIRIFISLLFCLAFITGKAQDTIPINGTWKVQPAENEHSRWYEEHIAIPANWNKKSVVADFRRIEGDAIIFVNDKRVTELLRPGGEVDLSAFLIYGKQNLLRVFITRDYNGISRNFAADPLRYYSRQNIPITEWPMGITAPVNIIARPLQAVTDVFCIPSFRDKTITLEVEVAAKEAKGAYQLRAQIFDQHNKEVLQFSSQPLQLKNGKEVYHLKANWADPVCWELDSPYLYKARVTLIKQDNISHSFRDVTFGFREIWTSGNKLYMNGHLSRWRLTDVYGTNQYGLSLYRLMGYNVGQFQPHHKLWWIASPETPLLNEDMLNEMDRTGMGCTVPGPSVTVIRDKLLKDPQAQIDYEKEVAYFSRQYRNHPCILAWVIAMNSANPKSNINPARMGKRDSVYSTQGKVIELACTIVKKQDPTRLVFAHADGSVGDISSANVYLNFVPLQEREEWPMAWAKEGNMPYSAVEFGAPYWHNFWKGNQFLLTEYLAMYLGDEAYTTEGEQGLRQTVAKSSIANSATWEQMDFTQYPGFWQFQELFTRNTNRSWRTWGINAGWLYWLLEGYGNPGGEKLKSFTQRYRSLKEPLTHKPAWANARYDIFSQANQPLLVYFAGAPVHTDKTHTFFAGETFQKQIAAVWDGAHQKELTIKWKLVQGEQILREETASFTLHGGEIRLIPITLKAPDVKVRTDMQLIMQTDTFSLTIFPQPEKHPLKISLYDPKRKSTSLLDQLGISTIPWKKGAAGILVIGREALQEGDTLPYSEADIAKGLRVIILEQLPAVWEGMGFETIEAMSRYTFIRNRSSPILKGLFPQDLVNWRGSPDLLPEGKHARAYDTQHAPKWTNRHAVASVALKTPEIAGFSPVLQTEFDMAYTPLLEWRYGKGKVTFCSLDLTDRVGTDPAATWLARNLFMAQQESLPALRQVYYSGNDAGRLLLEDLGIAVQEGTPGADAIWVIGGGNKNIATEKYKGILFHLPQTKEYLASQGLKTERKNIVQAHLTSGLMHNIGPNLLRWRDSLQVDAFEEGMLLEKGNRIYLQAGPDQLADRYPNAPEKQEAVQLSVIRMHQLIAQLLTNLGATPSPATAQRLNIISRPLGFQSLGSWKVLGPYSGNDITTVFPGQQDAITGAENPNLTYKREDGKILDWRGVVHTDANGFTDLSKALGGIDENAVAYVTRSIISPKAQNVILRLGVDYWMEVWLNGKSILQVTKNHQKRENEFILNVPVLAGENILTIKVASGKGGFGFWANMAYPGGVIENTVIGNSYKFYRAPFKYFDPYQFNYW